MVSSFGVRKPYPTKNVLIAINFALRFTYVLTYWEGSEQWHMMHLPFGLLWKKKDELVVAEGIISLC